MKVIVQRVESASCIVDDKIVGTIGHGFMLLVGFTHTDNEAKCAQMAKKIVNLRIFEDEVGKMNKSILDVDGNILSISQFTLYANPYSGNRPSFVDAMKPDMASELYNKFNAMLEQTLNKKVATGIFGADMKLTPVCIGPVTIELEF